MTDDLHVAMPPIPSLWGQAFAEAHRVRDISASLLDWLCERKYLLAILSNTEEPMVGFFLAGKKVGDWFYRAFHVTVFSCCEGVVKPDHRIYEITLKRLGVKPEEAIFLDDKEVYCEGARRVGMHAIRFETAEQAQADVRELLGM